MTLIPKICGINLIFLKYILIYVGYHIILKLRKNYIKEGLVQYKLIFKGRKVTVTNILTNNSAVLKSKEALEIFEKSPGSEYYSLRSEIQEYIDEKEKLIRKALPYFLLAGHDPKRLHEGELGDSMRDYCSKFNVDEGQFVEVMQDAKHIFTNQAKQFGMTMGPGSKMSLIDLDKSLLKKR